MKIITFRPFNEYNVNHFKRQPDGHYRYKNDYATYDFLVDEYDWDTILSIHIKIWDNDEKRMKTDLDLFNQDMKLKDAVKFVNDYRFYKIAKYIDTWN